MNKKSMIIGALLVALSTNVVSAMQPLTPEENAIIVGLHAWYRGEPDYEIQYTWLCLHYIPILKHENSWLKEQKNTGSEERIALNNKIIEALEKLQEMK